jgi:hypothetical protein
MACSGGVFLLTFCLPCNPNSHGNLPENSLSFHELRGDDFDAAVNGSYGFLESVVEERKRRGLSGDSSLGSNLVASSAADRVENTGLCRDSLTTREECPELPMAIVFVKRGRVSINLLIA